MQSKMAGKKKQRNKNRKKKGKTKSEAVNLNSNLLNINGQNIPHKFKRQRLRGWNKQA